MNSKRLKLPYEEVAISYKQPYQVFWQNNLMGNRTKWIKYRCMLCKSQAWITAKHLKDEYFPELCAPCGHATLERLPDNVNLNHYALLRMTVN